MIFVFLDFWGVEGRRITKREEKRKKCRAPFLDPEGKEEKLGCKGVWE